MNDQLVILADIAVRLKTDPDPTGFCVRLCQRFWPKELADQMERRGLSLGEAALYLVKCYTEQVTE